MKTFNFTFAEWVAAATTCTPNEPNSEFNVHKIVDKDKKPWSGVKTFADAVDIANNGYVPKGGFDSEVGSEASESSIISAMLDVSGSVVDVGLFLTGEPECMWEFQQVPSTKFVNLVINLSNNASVDASALFEYAAKVYSLVLRLKQKNIECNLTGVFQTNMGDGYRINIELHKQGSVFSAATLSAALHPSSLRRLFIGYMQSMSDYTFGCGKPQAPSVEEDEILLPSVQGIGSVDKIEERILSALESSIPA
jgi:hypothetical protein